MNTEQNCIASMISGCWIAAELAKDKGQPFAEMVIASDRWAFPKVTIEEAQAFLVRNEANCRCGRCRPPKPPKKKPVLPPQLSLF